MLNQLVRETDRRYLYLNGTFFTSFPTNDNALNVLERTAEPEKVYLVFCNLCKE
jgi:hypothetical protein